MGQRLAEAGNVLLEAVLLDQTQAVFSHRCAEGWIVDEAAQAAGEGVNVEGGIDESIEAVVDEVGLASDAIGDDNGAGDIHDFVDDQSPGLIVGGQDEEVAEFVNAGELGLVAEAEKADAGEAGLADAGFEVGAFFAVADDQQVSGWFGAGGGSETEEGLDEVDAALAGLQLGSIEDNGAAWLEAELAAEVLAMGSGFEGFAAEEVVVDGVGHGKGGEIAAEVELPVFVVELADGVDGAGGGFEEGKEKAFEGEEGFGAGVVLLIGFGADDNGNAEKFGCIDGVERGEEVIAEDPGGIEMAFAETLEDTPVEGGCKSNFIAFAEAGKEFVFVTVEERNFPLDADAAETGIFVATDGEVAAEEDGEIDVRLLGDAAEEGRLVLDGMADEIGDADGPGGMGGG